MASLFSHLDFPHGRRDGRHALLRADEPKSGDQISVALFARLLWCQFGQRCLPKPRRANFLTTAAGTQDRLLTLTDPRTTARTRRRINEPARQLCPPIRDTKADGRRVREGPIGDMCTAAKFSRSPRRRGRAEPGGIESLSAGGHPGPKPVQVYRVQSR